MSEIEQDIYYLWVALLYAGRFEQFEIASACMDDLKRYAEDHSLEYQKATELFCRRNEDGHFKDKNNRLCDLSNLIRGDI